MGSEMNLMRHYPVAPNRLAQRPNITAADRAVARQFGRDYFDGERKFGYGGFTYHPRFWTETVKLFADHYALDAGARILDIGCGKGFMLKDFRALLPASNLVGLDVSTYAIENADPEVAHQLVVGDARSIPFPDSSFDLVISINTLHNLERLDCIRALAEVERVASGNSFVMVDGWRTEAEREMLEAWVLTAVTMLHVEEWISLFDEAGYTGDYAFWTVV
jgi:SAM-dependent methyltransferase